MTRRKTPIIEPADVALILDALEEALSIVESREIAELVSQKAVDKIVRAIIILRTHK